MTTLSATKYLLALAVCLFGMPTYSAHPAGVAWVYQNHWYTRQQCLVGDEHTELVERPTMSLCSLGFPNRSPLIDAREVFKGNRRIGVFGCPNELFADNVIGVGTETSLTTTYLPQLSLACFRRFLLELSPLSEILHPYFLYRFAMENLTIGG